jgi:Glycosyl transferase family 2
VGHLGRIVATSRRRLGRAAHGTGLATRADVRALRAETERLRAELLAALPLARLGTLEAHRAALEAHQAALEAHQAALAARTDCAERARREQDGRLADVEREQRELEGRLAPVERLLEVAGFTRFMRHAPLSAEPLISIVLPTYNRPGSLPRAIESVTAQRYQRWELIVVDDGGDIDSNAIVERIGDSRIRYTRIDHRGVCAARNAALDRCEGEIIAYLDDDNVMDSDWLYAVAWAFVNYPAIGVLYGAFVIDDLLRVDGKSSGQLPRMFLRSWDRESLRHGNLTDMGAIAHRAGLPDARFDESLEQMGDWDLLLRLTEQRDPLVLPAIACYYMTDAHDRLTLGPTRDADLSAVLARAALAPR